MPGQAKMTRIPCASSQPPTGERGPTARTKMSPEITGETANGTSMRAVSSVLPRKSNLPIVHPAASPKTTFAGTTTAAVASVSRMRRERVGLDQGPEVRGHAVAEGLHEHRGDRQDDDDPEETERDDDERHAEPRPRSAARDAVRAARDDPSPDGPSRTTGSSDAGTIRILASEVISGECTAPLAGRPRRVDDEQQERARARA